MIVVMKPNATAGEIGAVIARVQELGLHPHPIYGEEHTVIAIVGNERKIDKEIFEVMPGVEKTMVVMHPFKLASRTSKPEDTVISLNGTKIGGKRLTVMAGPCSVESRSQLLETAWAVKEAGAQILRKPQPAPGNGLGGQRSRCADPARRRLQTAQLTLQLPGPGPQRAGIPGRSP